MPYASNNAGSSFFDGKLFHTMSNGGGGYNLLTPGNINIVSSMNSSTPQNNQSHGHHNYHSSMKRQNSSGSNFNLQIPNVSTPGGLNNNNNGGQGFNNNGGNNNNNNNNGGN